jgi:hypothetical protein
LAKEQQEEEARMKIEEELKAKEDEAKQAKADEEMMQLVIEMSMQEFEEEEKEREQAKKAEILQNNSLAKSLASKGALSKYSKQGFVPKALRKEDPASTAHQENISENEYSGYDYEQEQPYYAQR